MATKLNLVTGIWQELSAGAVVFDIGTRDVMELTDAASLPTGDQACLIMRPPHLQSLPAPAAGSWYVRCAAKDSTVTYSEVS